MNISPFFIVQKEDKTEDLELQRKIWSKISSLGKKGKGPILQDVLLHPELFGVKSPVRQELIKIVMNSLQKAGFVGDKLDYAVQASLEHILRIRSQQDDGGFF